MSYSSHAPYYYYLVFSGRSIYKGEGGVHKTSTHKQFNGPLSRPGRLKPKPRLPHTTSVHGNTKELPQQKSTTSGEYSFDLELGASASKVNQRQKENAGKSKNCLQKLTKGKLGSSTSPC